MSRNEGRFEGKVVLITGAAGFLGSHLCDRFIKEGYHVIAMDNLITGDLSNIEHLFKYLSSHHIKVVVGFYQVIVEVL